MFTQSNTLENHFFSYLNVNDNAQKYTIETNYSEMHVCDEKTSVTGITLYSSLLLCSLLVFLDSYMLEFLVVFCDFVEWLLI